MANKKTYPVSQEFIEEMYNSSHVCTKWKGLIAEEFPEAFGPEFEFLDSSREEKFKLGTSSRDPIYIADGHRPKGAKAGRHLVLNEVDFDVSVEQLTDAAGNKRLYVSFKPKNKKIVP